MKLRLGLFFFLPLLVPEICRAQEVYPRDAVLDTARLELPAVSPLDTIVIHDGYTVSFRPSLRQPVWVAYNLTVEELEAVTERSGSFKKDPVLPWPQATNNDYLRSGYDKGHMAPAADMKWSEKVMGESFYFTNICPQTPQLNRICWLALEDQVRNLAKRYGSVWIVCGPVFEGEPSVIGKNRVPIPHKFYKAVLAFDGDRCISAAFLFVNDDSRQSLWDIIMTVDNLEGIIGLDLFHNLNEGQAAVAESILKQEDWL